MDIIRQNCKLCGSTISDEDSKVIDEDIKDILDILLLKLTFEDRTTDVMCTMCCSKLRDALNFKSTCLSTDETIIPYIDFENPEPVDLKDVYAKEKQSKLESSVVVDLEICRLCFVPTSGNHTSVQEVSVDTIKMYIPEVNFTVTTNPVMCMSCIDALQRHSTFIRMCLDIDAKTNVVNIEASDILSTNSSSDKEEIEVQSNSCMETKGTEREEFAVIINSCSDTEETEIITNFGSDIEQFEVRPNSRMEIEKTETASQLTQISDKENNDKRDSPAENIVERAVPRYKCKRCKYRTKSKVLLVTHESQHRRNLKKCKRDTSSSKTNRRPSGPRSGSCLKKARLTHADRNSIIRHQVVHGEAKKYKCDECEYEGKRGDNLKTHKLVHRSPSEVKLYKCKECDYKSKHKNYVTKHEVTHGDFVHKCVKCTFQTKAKRYLMIHMRVHKDPGEVETYRCDKCTFESKYRQCLTQHKKVHKELSERPTFKCALCTFKTYKKRNLGPHMLNHKDPSEVPSYECALCPYQTVHRYQLVRHLQVCRFKNDPEYRKLLAKHKEAGKTYKCDKCKYETVHKVYMSHHQRVAHKSTSYKCEHCPFETKYREKIQDHLLRHKDPSKVNVFICQECGFRTKKKCYLTSHEQRHKDPSEVKMYECSDCNYKTIEKGNLNRHLRKHKMASELFSCNQCTYNCKSLRTLQAHQSKHSKTPEGESKTEKA